MDCVIHSSMFYNFYLFLAFQDLEWHAVDDLDFDDAEADILEIVHESGTPVLDGIEPFCTSD